MKNVKYCLKLLLVISLLLISVVALASCSCEHEWEDIEVMKEATCLDEGRAKSTCKLCGVTRKRDLPKTGHQGKTFVIASCTEEGYTVIDCPVCGYYEKYDVIPARGHENKNNSIFCSRCRVVTSCENYFLTLLEYTEQDSIHFGIDSLPVTEEIYIISMEMRLAPDADGTLVGEGFALLRGGEDGTRVDTYIYGDTLYLCDRATQGYQVIPLAVILEKIDTGVSVTPANPEDVNISLDELVAFLEEELAPLIRLGEIISDEELNLRISQVVSSLFEVTIYQGYNFNLSAYNLKELNERLSRDTVASFIDREFGRGSFDNLEKLTLDLLSSTVSEIIFGALAEGVTIEDMVEALDALAVLLTGDGESTASGLLGEIIGEAGLDLLTVLTDKALLSKTVADLVAEGFDEPKTGEEILTELRAMLTRMREESLYSIAGVPGSEVSDTREAYDGQIDAYLDLFSFGFSGSEDGELLRVYVGMPLGSSYQTKFTLYFGESDAPSVGDVPERVEALLGALKVESGTELENYDDTKNGVIRTSSVEFIALEDGTVVAIRSRVSMITYEFSGRTETVIHNGVEQTAWLYDAVEEIVVFDFPLTDPCEMYLKDDCCSWIFYSFNKTMPVEYTRNTFIISEIWKDRVFGDILTTETVTVEADSTVGFWYNEKTGEVRIDNDFETHEYVYEKTVEAENCRSERYEIWGCPDCDKEERRNVTQGAHVPMDGRGYCSLCGSMTFNPEDAIYIYESEDDEGYVEFFEIGEAIGYIEVDGEYRMYDLTWKEENGQFILYFFWNDRTVLVLEMVDGRLVKAQEQASLSQ